MEKSYDFTQLPPIDPKTLMGAKAMGLNPCHVICVEADDATGDHVGGAIAMFVASLPGIGEQVQLEDGRYWEVKQVVHRVTTLSDPDRTIIAMPVVICWPSAIGQEKPRG